MTPAQWIAFRRRYTSAAPSSFATTGNTAWWRADDIVGSPCSSMNARVGSITLDQATAGFRPTVSAGTCYGQDELVCDTTDDHMVSSAALSSLIAAGTGTIYFVGRVTSYLTDIAAPAYTNQAYWASGGAWCGLHARSSSSGVAFAYNYDTTDDYAPSASGEVIGDTDPHLLTWRHSGGNLYFRIDNGSWSSVASGDTGGGLSDNFRAGGQAGGWGIKWAEIAIYNVDTTTGSDDTDNLAYLASRYSGIW